MIAALALKKPSACSGALGYDRDLAATSIPTYRRFQGSLANESKKTNAKEQSHAKCQEIKDES
jgi:hypothetical protein